MAVTVGGTVPANTLTRYERFRVIPEDLSDVIEMVAQEDTPMTSNIGRSKMDQTYHEWNTDALSGANDDNAWAEGEDAVSEFRDPTNRMGNYSQIMRKIPAVSGTLQAVKTVGGQKTLARELMKAGRELKLDREKRLCSTKPAAPGSHIAATTVLADVRQMAGFGAWLVTNVVAGAGSTDPAFSGVTEGYPTAARGDGTNAAFTETMLKDAMQQAWSEGGKPTIAMMSGSLKVKASAFTGIAQQRYNATGAKPTTIIGAADVYVSDFGNLAFVPNVYMPAEVCYLIDPEQVEMMTLRPVSTTELAKTGDSEKRLMLWEGSLKVNNEKAHAGIFDIT